MSEPNLLGRLRAIVSAGCEGYRAQYVTDRIGEAIDEIEHLQVERDLIAKKLKLAEICIDGLEQRAVEAESLAQTIGRADQ